METAANEFDERGQTTIALAGVLAVAALAMVAIATIGQAMVHRAVARNAADAVALAAATDLEAAEQLGNWYQAQGVQLTIDGQQTWAHSGPSQAVAWASQASVDLPAPALVAVVARAEQLVGATIVPVRWHPLAIDVVAADAGLLRMVAADLGLCESLGFSVEGGTVHFEMC